MASVVTYDDGLRRIEFTLIPNGQRRAIRLGRISAKAAEAVKARVEAIISDVALGRPHDAELSAWLAGRDEAMLAKLRAVGLAEGVGLAETTLGQFMDKFFSTLAGKQSTRISYGHTKRNLLEYFTAGRLLRTITAAEADAWRAWMVEDQGLAIPTVARRVIAARTMWRKAMRWKLAAENPFVGVKSGHQTNEARKCFVRREVIDQLIAEAPDAEWAVIIALARYGGLRCPSEHYALKWGDIDWARGTVRVTVPKLAHVEGNSHRIIPLFPEIREPLLKLFAEAAEGTEHVITRNRLDCMNLRRRFEQIIVRAGLAPWPKLFHNLRASRETELMREYDLATVCKWIGNSPAVAAKHYATSVDLNADFKRAAAVPEAQQKAQQSASATGEQPLNDARPTDQNSREKPGFVETCQSAASAGETGEWAIQGSNL